MVYAFKARGCCDARYVDVVEDETRAHLRSLRVTEFLRIWGGCKLESKTVGRVRLVVPPPDQQRAIAAFLERETARIDDVIGKVETADPRVTWRRRPRATSRTPNRIPGSR
jgi:hypothetical protein